MAGFSQNRLIKNILIPASVEIIGNSTFFRCNSLENVIFEEGSNLTSLERDVFAMTNIKSFQIPEKVNYIWDFSFAFFRLTNISIHERNNNFCILDNVIFSKNKSILLFNINLSRKSYDIPFFVTTLAMECFAHSNITNITIPTNVKIIEHYAFFYCLYLINVTILSSLDHIGSRAFANCPNLERVVFPNSSMTVKSKTLITRDTPKVKLYFTCKTLFTQKAVDNIVNVSISYLDIYMPNLIINQLSLIMDLKQTIILEFWGYSIDNITIPNSVTMINGRAFENSTIREVLFEENSSIREIFHHAFQNCHFLKLFIVSSPSSLFIGNTAFKNCFNLSSVKFESSNITFSNNVFENCFKLNEMINITNPPYACFFNCKQLSHVNILEGSTQIDVYAFYNCISLSSLTIPSSIKVISHSAICKCLNLRSITFAAKNNLESISGKSFSDCSSLSSISNFYSNYYQCINNTIYDKRDNNIKLIFYAPIHQNKLSISIVVQYVVFHFLNVIIL